jgi:hypothetical protein
MQADDRMGVGNVHGIRPFESKAAAQRRTRRGG